MRIAVLTDEFPALSETFVLNQITGLLELGQDVEVFAGRPRSEAKTHSDVIAYELPKRTHYFRMPEGRVARAAKAPATLAKGICRNPRRVLNSLNLPRFGRTAASLKMLYAAACVGSKDFDVLLCHFGSSGNIGAYLKQLGLSAKVVTMFHGWDIRSGDRHGAHIWRPVMNHGDCFLAVSSYTRTKLMEFGADPSSIIDHPVGIDLSKFVASPPDPWHDKRPVVVLTVARLCEEKGLECGIEAVGRLARRHPELPLEYRIVGEGGTEARLRRMVREMGLGGTVRFLGAMRQEHVVEAMRNADLFMLPSVTEALGVVLLEAQAMRRPVVATRVGGVCDAVVEGGSALVVSPRDPSALSEKLEHLIGHPETWPVMGAIGRRFVEENYDINVLNRRLVEVFKSLIMGECPGGEPGESVASRALAADAPRACAASAGLRPVRSGRSRQRLEH